VFAVAAAAAISGGACDRSGATAPPRAPGDAVVVSVTDGDTIRVRLGEREEKVRLIGIDTPETHGQGGLRECFGKEASRRTAELLPEGATVRLVRDAEQRDRYGRLLAYVYTSDGTFVNLRLAEEGYAATLTIPPNVAHSDAFAAAAARAREANRGLWGMCGGPDTPVRRIPPLPSPP
jgi:micrococcal nuclease